MLNKEEITKDVFIMMYSEHSNWSRHQESQRSGVSSLIVSITGIFIALISFDNKFNSTDIPFSLFIIFLGVIGVVLSYKYYIQFKFHDTRVEKYKSVLNDLGLEVDISAIDSEVNRKIRGKYQFFSSLNLYKIWIFFHILIIFFGLLLTVFLFFKN